MVADFVSDGRAQLDDVLRSNTVSNASAALFRERLYDGIGDANTNYRLVGDWYT
jgi:hypothetical protein